MKLDKVTNLVSLLIYFLSIAQVAKKTILSSTLEYSPWSYSELIIFYPGLFTRRGFLGELITLIDSDLILFDTVNFILFIFDKNLLNNYFSFFYRCDIKFGK
jgi:hypothetical protein